MLRDFFITVLAADDSDTEDAACQMEHAIQRVILERLMQFANLTRYVPAEAPNGLPALGIIAPISTHR